MSEGGIQRRQLSSAGGVVQCTEESSQCVVEHRYRANASLRIVGLSVDADGHPTGCQWRDKWLEEGNWKSRLWQHRVEIQSDLSCEAGFSASSELQGVSDKIDAVEPKSGFGQLEVTLGVPEGGLAGRSEAEHIEELDDDGQFVEFSGTDLQLPFAGDR